MATIKSYTDLEQSKKLAEILPLETADMWWTPLNWQETEYYVEVKQDGINQPKKAIPCWNLAALLKLMPKIGAHEPMLRKLYYISEPTERYICQYSLTDMTSEYDNPVDACYEMIIKLHGLNLL